MSRRSSSLVAGVGLAVLLTGVLTACATGSGSGPAPSGTATGSGGGAGTEIEVDAAWLDNGRVVGLVTQGSSSCPPTAGDVALNGAVLEVTLVEPAADTACTRDMAPRVTLVDLPSEVDPSQELEIRVTGEGYYGDTDLDGVDGLDPSGETDYLPTAGWTDTDGQFVVLSWGSSSCVPVLESAAASGPDEVTVTFVTPPDDQVCTMDMVGRGTVVFADGLEDDSDVFAVLTGAEFDNVRIPIVGSD